jgi:hypothetical protein
LARLLPRIADSWLQKSHLNIGLLNNLLKIAQLGQFTALIENDLRYQFIRFNDPLAAFAAVLDEKVQAPSVKRPETAQRSGMPNWKRCVLDRITLNCVQPPAGSASVRRVSMC